MNDPAQNVDAQPQEPKPKRSKLPLFVVIGVLVIAAALILSYVFFVARFVVTTNDAYVDGNIVEVFPRAEGTLTEITVNDTDYVQKGQILAKIDPTQYQLAFDESLSQLAMAVRSTQQMFDQIGELTAALDQQMVYLNQAQMHYNNRLALVDIGGVSREEFEDAKNGLEAACAEVVKLEESLKKAQAQTFNTTVLTHPQVINAQERIKQSWVQLQNTQIIAPTDGYVAKRNIQVGENVSLKQPILALVPLSNLWVTANFKEVQLKKIRLGQPVKVKTDMYKKSFIFDGIVLGISPGTGSVFSILPPQNATGNWIKIVQRVPVRIGLKPKDIQQYPLRVGLSTEVKIDIHDQTGGVLTSPRPACAIDETSVYDHQLKGVDSIIESVIQSNIQCSNDN